MKTTAFLLATSGLLATAFASEPQIDLTQFDQALTQAQSAAVRGQMNPSSYDEIRGMVYRFGTTISPDPEEESTRQLLQDAVSDLESRARESWVAETDFVRMREQVILMWLDMHMQKLQRMARAGGADRARYLAYAAQLEELARSWTPSRPDDAAYRERVQGQIRGFIARARAAEGIEPIDETRLLVLQERCDRCLVDMERRARAGQASRYDFTYMAYVILATAEMQMAQNDPRAFAVIRERLNNALASLQQAEPPKPWLRVGAAPLDTMTQINKQLKDARRYSEAVEAGTVNR